MKAPVEKGKKTREINALKKKIENLKSSQSSLGKRLRKDSQNDKEGKDDEEENDGKDGNPGKRARLDKWREKLWEKFFCQGRLKEN